MPVRRTISALAFLCVALTSSSVHAAREWLNTLELQLLFRGGITFSYWAGQSELTFTFRDDRNWTVETGLGGEAWGTWSFKNNFVCWNETDKQGLWPGLKRKFGCFGIKREASDLFLGKFEYPLTLKDPSVLARLQNDPRSPNLAALADAASGKTQLTQRQVKALLRGGLVYSLQGSKTNLEFTYTDDGGWRVETGLGGTAWGRWHISKRKLCRKETGTSNGWKGLKSKNTCFGFKRSGNRFFLGSRNVPISFADPGVVARLDNQPAKLAQAQSDLAKQKQELEQQKLALERERAAVERQRLENEKRALARNKPKEPAIPDIAFGAYHAVVIGIDNYQNLPKLKTAVTDARAVAQALRDHYGYTVHLLENPDRGDIIDKFDELREALAEEDNLLIYYAGHGWLDEQSGRGYWLPVDAKEDRRSRWLSNADLTDALQAMFAKHVMIVADSCFSGTLTRAVKLPDRSPNYIERIAEKRVRVVLTSGGLEPVIDSGGGRHSVFAAQFLRALRDNEGVLDGTQLFRQVRQSVVLNADQTPEYSDIRKAGHEGGDFLFVRSK